MGDGTYIVGAGFDTWVDKAETPLALAEAHYVDARLRAAAAFPASSTGINAGGYNGVDAYTARMRSVVGFVPGYSSLYLASGYSGRGYKVAPALAAAAAWEITGIENAVFDGIFPDRGVFEDYRMTPEVVPLPPAGSDV